MSWWTILINLSRLWTEQSPNHDRLREWKKRNKTKDNESVNLAGSRTNKQKLNYTNQILKKCLNYMVLKRKDRDIANRSRC